MRLPLRSLIAVTLLTSLISSVSAQNIGISPNALAPDAQALMDINVSGLPVNGKKGLLIPRMTYAQRLLIAGLGINDRGLWVYQTTDAIPAPADPTLNASLAHGFWYWDGAIWVRWAAGAGSWQLTGNGGTASATNYIGTRATSTGLDLHIRTNEGTAQPQMIVTNGVLGNVGVNPAGAPVERLDINGGLKVGNTVLNTAGAIKFDNTAVSPNRWHYGNLDNTATGWRRLENAEVEYPNQSYRPVDTLCLGGTGQAVLGNSGAPVFPVAGSDVETPFATNTGAALRRAHHVQYIYKASELDAAGLCAGLVTAVSFYILQSDVQIVGPPVTGADVQVELRLRNSPVNDFAVDQWDKTAGWYWQPGAGATLALNTDSVIAFLAQPGWKQWNLRTTGPNVFSWDGVSNVVMDFCWIRSPVNGNSPAVALETGLAYQATKSLELLNNNFINHGRTMRDVPQNPLAADATIFTHNSRPVTRFNGRIKTLGNTAADAFAPFINYAGGLVIDTITATPTWADANYRGPGTVRAKVAVYDGTVQLSDHVFDSYYAAGSEAAETSTTSGYAYVGVGQLEQYLKENRHLPNMPSRDDWNTTGTPSLGQLQTGLWETVETQALHIAELEKDLSSLEQLAFAKNSSPEDLERLLKEIQESRRLSDLQKMHLADAVRQRLSSISPSK